MKKLYYYAMVDEEGDAGDILYGPTTKEDAETEAESMSSEEQGRCYVFKAITEYNTTPPRKPAAITTWKELK